MEGLFNEDPKNILNVNDEILRYWDMLATVITFPRSGSNDERIEFYRDFNELFKREIKKGRDIKTFDPKKDLLIGLKNNDWTESTPEYQIVLFKKGELDNYLQFGTWQEHNGWRIETSCSVNKAKAGYLDYFSKKPSGNFGRVWFPIDIKSLGWKWEKLWKNGMQNIRY